MLDVQDNNQQASDSMTGNRYLPCSEFAVTAQTPDTPSPVSPFYGRVFALATLLILGALLYRVLEPFFSAITWALFIAFLIHPLHVRLAQRLGARAQLSALALTLTTLLILLGPLTALTAAIASQAGDLLQMVQTKVTEHDLAGIRNITEIPGIGPLLDWAQRTVGISAEEIQTWIIERGRNVLEAMASTGGRVFVGAIGTVVSFSLTIFLLFFFVRDGENMMATVRILIPLSAERKAHLFAHLGAVIRAVVYGTGLTALLQGLLVGIAFAIVGLPSPLVFAVMAALLALLPFGGTALIWGPAALILAGQQRYGAAVFLLVWGVVLVGTIDNLLKPILVSSRAPVATLTVFIGVLGGIAAFGAAGLFLGPVLLALVIALLEFAVDIRRRELGSAQDDHPEVKDK
jgi:predicted PurR-regulated permease PerM